MYTPQTLTALQIERCLNTVSSNAFYLIVADKLVRRESLSVVRMADGEKALFENFNFNESWNERLGVKGIEGRELIKRMALAINTCDYFASSISGVVMNSYFMDDYKIQSRYIDNFFPHAWFESMKVNLYKEAKHVLIIHRNENTANALIKRAKEYLGVKVSYLHLSNWDQAENVVEQASKIDAPLVIFSAGPASKWIGPEIAKQGKVTLDIGQAMDKWTLIQTEQENRNI